MYKFSAWLAAFIILVSGTFAFAREVYVSGECVGVKLYTDGLIITDTVAVTDTDGKTLNIAEGYGIKKGDIIKRVNGKAAVDAKSITDVIDDGSEITLTLLSDGVLKDVAITPVQTDNGCKLGLWLRDSTAGLGTVTCYDGNRFAALGHGVCDIDTGNIMPVRYGIIQECTVNEIAKGEKGSPGALIGDIDGDDLGEIKANTNLGLFGEAIAPHGKKVEIAKASEVKCEKALILSDIGGDGVKEYEIEIKRLYLPSSIGKDMIIKITDKRLIEKTGGIVQGMSGSPIIQDGKLIGAITHVFVNDPTKGYGIFIENMLAEAEKIK